MKFKGFTKFCVAALLILLVPAGAAKAADITVIKNVTPTMFEKEIVPLIKVGEINPEVGKDQFIFSPFAFVVNESNQLFVFDRMQSKMFKLDPAGRYLKSWGSVGRGPGEFGGKGRFYVLFMSLGADGLLYLFDTRGYKFLVFDQNGTFIRQVNYRRLVYTVAVDSKGNLVFYEVKNKILNVFNEKQEILFTQNMEQMKIESLIKNNSSRARRRQDFTLWSEELQLLMTEDDTLLMYFSNSAKLWVVKNKKRIREIKVWPKDVLDRYKEELKVRGSANFFLKWFLDGDDKRAVFFQVVGTRPKYINRLYRISLDGKLTSVLSLDVTNDEVYTKFHAKKNGRYLARYDDKIIIFEEARK